MGFLDKHCLFQELTDEKLSVSKPFYCGNDDLDEFFMKMYPNSVTISWARVIALS